MQISRRIASGVAAATVLVSAALVPGAPVSASTAKANPYTPFIGKWNGHDRYLAINAQGVGVEHYYDGCCSHVVDIRFQLSKVRRLSNGRPVARLTVTKVRHYDPSNPVYGDAKPGDHGVATVSKGVFSDTLLGTSFCSPNAKAGACGA